MRAGWFPGAAVALRGAALAAGVALAFHCQAQQEDLGPLEPANADAWEAAPADAMRPAIPDDSDLLAAARAAELLPALERELQSKPKDAALRYRLGEAYLALGREAEAKAAFEASLKTDPDHAFAVDARMRVAELTARERAAQARIYPKAGSEFKDCAQCPAMRVLPAGEFEMRTPPAPWGRFYDEGYVRHVRIREPFAMGKYEVTFDEWQACVRDKKCPVLKDEGWGRGRRPAIYVSWADADGYVKWLSKKTGKSYRLPTEAQWEYAARAGGPDKGRFFGIAAAQICEYANMHDLTAKGVHNFEWEHIACDDKFAVTAPVGSFKPNAFGLYDMLGNVWEWTVDCQNATWRGAPEDASAWPGGDCSERVYRGGSWINHPPTYLRQTDYFKYVGTRHNDLGFRVVRDLP